MQQKTEKKLTKKDKKQKIFYPINEKTLFNINQNFRVLTRNLKKEEKLVNTKGRKFKIENYEGVIRLNFRELCCRELIDMHFDGYAIGGLSVGESAQEMYEVLDFLKKEIKFFFKKESSPGNHVNFLNLA